MRPTHLLLALSCASNEPMAFAGDIEGVVIDVTTEYEAILKGELDPADLDAGQRAVRLNASEELRVTVVAVAAMD